MASLYLIPCVLAEDATDTIATYVLEAVKKCTVIFAENERTARRFLKSMDKTIVIDDFEWFAIHKAEEEQLQHFIAAMKAQKKHCHHKRGWLPGHCRPWPVFNKSCAGYALPCKTTGRAKLYFAGINGQWYEWPAV